jgi:hypothetical protein
MSRMADRLALAGLRWRFGWSFRFAHHPLCDRFAAQVWRFGCLRICAGCTCLLGGAVLAAISGWVAGGWQPWWALPWTAAMTGVLAASWPSWYARWPAPVRQILRALTGAGLAGPVLAAMAGYWPIALAMASGLAVVRLPFARSRALRRGQACAGCPHLGVGVCPGFADHAEAWRRIDDAWAARVAVRAPANRCGDPPYASSPA